VYVVRCGKNSRSGMFELKEYRLGSGSFLGTGVVSRPLTTRWRREKLEKLSNWSSDSSSPGRDI
jgi:hypothetical protein